MIVKDRIYTSQEIEEEAKKLKKKYPKCFVSFTMKDQFCDDGAFRVDPQLKIIEHAYQVGGSWPKTLYTFRAVSKTDEGGYNYKLITPSK